MTNWTKMAVDAIVGPTDSNIADSILSKVVPAIKITTKFLEGEYDDEEEEDDTSAFDIIQNEEDPEVKLKLLEEYKEDLPLAFYHYTKGECFDTIADTKEEELEERNSI